MNQEFADSSFYSKHEKWNISQNSNIEKNRTIFKKLKENNDIVNGEITHYSSPLSRPSNFEAVPFRDRPLLRSPNFDTVHFRYRRLPRPSNFKTVHFLWWPLTQVFILNMKNEIFHRIQILKKNRKILKKLKKKRYFEWKNKTLLTEQTRFA